MNVSIINNGEQNQFYLFLFNIKLPVDLLREIESEGIAIKTIDKCADIDVDNIEGTCLFPYSKLEEMSSHYNANEGKLDDISFFLCGNQKNEDMLDFVDGILPEVPSKNILFKTLKSELFKRHSKYENLLLRKVLETKSEKLQQLTHIGQQLMMEKDTSQLLNLILSKSREMTSSDAGSLYLIEKNDEGEKQLRFTLTQNDSANFEFKEFTMPISRESLSGYVAATGERLNLDDVYDLPEGSEFSFNKNFDKSIEYRTKSMLVIPLVSHNDDVIGVIQLINRKNNINEILKSKSDFVQYVSRYSEEDIEMVSALAGHAAVSIENNLLYRSIERLFEGFVNASVTAIESRDPTTSGHSSRVATLTVELAQKVDSIQVGTLRHIKFSEDQIKEIRYASLLHDFGKVGVREDVLLKAKKLYPSQLTEIRYRIAMLKNVAHIKYLRQKVDALQSDTRYGKEYRLHELEVLYSHELEKLDVVMAQIEEINEPTVLKSELAAELNDIAKIAYWDPSGKSSTLLSDIEKKSLTIGRGSLGESERLEIESHVSHTYEFLKRVPWTSELQNIPNIAYKHHEKLNGQGYPNSIERVEIPIQSRMMTIADIFDALTASDRPYKKAVPVEKALDILGYEVKDNHVDKRFLDVFIESKIYKTVL